jgi:hypothetical protein
MKNKRSFGFVCPRVSFLVSRGMVLPRADGVPLGKALLPGVSTSAVTGRYDVTVHQGGAEVCRLSAVVAWVRHRLVNGTFLVLKVARPKDFQRRLELLKGKDVELEFIPRIVPLDVTLGLVFGDPDLTPSLLQRAKPVKAQPAALLPAKGLARPRG